MIDEMIRQMIAWHGGGGVRASLSLPPLSPSRPCPVPTPAPSPHLPPCHSCHHPIHCPVPVPPVPLDPVFEKPDDFEIDEEIEMG